MDEFNRLFDKAIRALDNLAAHIDTNQNVKEYLIEAGDWSEDNEPETNILLYLEKYYC